ncbi:cytochrome P450 [Embleya scabrispora]|uniref:cytochrome P450 n=1 Tax=Embleya scabrispora TaxID=159449 RepID=UPI00037DAD73|nr:cytochrome P450 [Embleya scabrispora]MYS83253.1 cytochrome P450 [Streptomyces sp. SID5474]
MTAPTTRDIHLLDRDWYAGDPFADYAWLREHAPVYHSERAGVWGLSRHADLAWAERNPELFSSAKGSRPIGYPQPSMIDSDDPTHYRRRKLVSKGFTPRQIAAMEEHVRDIVTSLIDAMLAGGRGADLVRQFSAPLPMTLIGELLGVGAEHRDQLQHWADVMVMLSDGGELSHKAGEAFTEYVAYTTQVIEDRRKTPSDDLIGILVGAEIDGEKLSFDELIGESLLLLVGGNETTRNVISGGIAALLANPEQLARLREDPALIPSAVEESLRWVSPVVNMARHTTRDVELHGTVIPADSTVMMLYGAANRDAEVFAEPERFDAFRTPNPHIAFGTGPHFCLGSSLARLEIRVAFEELLRRLPDLRLAPGAELAHGPSSFIRGLIALPVEF